ELALLHREIRELRAGRVARVCLCLWCALCLSHSVLLLLGSLPPLVRSLEPVQSEPLQETGMSTQSQTMCQEIRRSARCRAPRLPAASRPTPPSPGSPD